MKLFYYPNTASLAPHFLLKHVNANFQLVLVDKVAGEQKSAKYLKLNPAGRIPTLIVDGQAIFESPAICIHVAELFPAYQLIPPLGDQLRPLFFQWLAFLNNTLQAELMIRYYPGRHTRDSNQESNIIAAQELRIADVLSVINEQLSGKKYLLGDCLTVCDFFLFMLAEWSLVVERSPLSFKHLAAYLHRMAQHPTIQAVCEVEAIDLTPFLK